MISAFNFSGEFFTQLRLADLRSSEFVTIIMTIMTRAIMISILFTLCFPRVRLKPLRFHPRGRSANWNQPEYHNLTFTAKSITQSCDKSCRLFISNKPRVILSRTTINLFIYSQIETINDRRRLKSDVRIATVQYKSDKTIVYSYYCCRCCALDNYLPRNSRPHTTKYNDGYKNECKNIKARRSIELPSNNSCAAFASPSRHDEIRNQLAAFICRVLCRPFR